MSSSSSSSSSTSINTTTAVMEHHLTYFCNPCNTDVTPTAAAALLCPHCNSPIPSNPNPNPNPNPLDQNPSESELLTSFVHPSVPPPPPTTTTTTSDDNFLLDSPYLHRLIHHLTNSNDTSPSRYNSPTSKSAIESIPSVTITSEFLLQIDPIVLCAVCKEQFVINDVTKQLPCKHMYHPDCILPWLSHRNTCPVCRFELPKEAVGRGLKVRRRSRSRVLRFGDLMEDEVMLGIGFSNLHRQYLDSESSNESMVPFARSEESFVVDVLPDLDRAGRVDNMSGWANWNANVNGGAVEGGENDGDAVLP